MINKIITTNQLKDIRQRYFALKKKVVLVHGVYDLVHPGHLEYFSEAKEQGNILVVSLTSDRYVNKGINKPYFNQKTRSFFLQSLEIVDHVVISDSASSISIIKNLKPSYYCKGPDYLKKKGDLAGNLKKEKMVTESYGGKIFFTKGQTFSSTNLINENFNDFNLGKKSIDKMFVRKKDRYNLIENFYKTLAKIKKEKILIIGEIILDSYIYSEALGTPSKETIISVNYEKKINYLGGTIPVLKNISEINSDITFASFYKKNSFKKQISKSLNKNIKLKLFNQKNFKEIKKTRFVNATSNEKFFEYYEFNNNYYENPQLKNYLKKNLNKFDRVIVCDFGHGIVNKDIVKILEHKSKNLCVNVQTNSGNRGYNLFTKFTKANLLCIDEPELRLGLSKRYGNVSSILREPELAKFKNLMITRGNQGLIFSTNQKRKKNSLVNFPALNLKVVDTMGAGDSVFSFVSCMIGNTLDLRSVAIIGSIAGALKTNIKGHSSHVKIDDILKSLRTLLK